LKSSDFFLERKSSRHAKICILHQYRDDDDEIKHTAVETRATIGIGSSGSWYKGAFSGNDVTKEARSRTPIELPPLK
jgi:hypothetical protein